MISVTIDLDTSRFDRMMSDFPVRMAAAKRRALAAIGTAVASRAQLAFRTASLRPAPWAPRKPSKRDDGHPLLIRSGNLRIRHELIDCDLYRFLNGDVSALNEYRGEYLNGYAWAELTGGYMSRRLNKP